HLASAFAALAFRAVTAVPVHGVAHTAARAFAADEPEPRLARRTLDDEAHDDALDAAGGIEGDQPDVVPREAPAAVVQLQQHSGGIAQIEHRHAEHLPVRVARVRIVGVLDAPGIAVAQAVFDLQ